MEGKIGISHTLRISKLLKLHTWAFTKFGFFFLFFFIGFAINVQNDKVEKLHSIKDMIRACKIENEETAWCSIFQIHKKEFRK